MSASVEYPPAGDDFENLFNGKLEPPQRLPHIRVQEHVVPDYFLKFVDPILNFEVRDDDVWVCSFPKTGTTWTQEMVWCIANDLNFEAAKAFLSVRFPFFEVVALRAQYLTTVMPDVEFPPHIIDSVNYITDLPSPRFIKTHLPFHLLPLQLQEGQTGAKIVYVARNAKDTCLSFYHHNQLLYGYSGTLDDFCTIFYNESRYWRVNTDYGLTVNYMNIHEWMPLYGNYKGAIYSLYFDLTTATADKPASQQDVTKGINTRNAFLEIS
ncbi:aryl sulfotransferase activity protein [Homalodisca vitripennis]|nr:aryl sulfotransferase activity protein [Homalodisca vitripennis]